MLIEEEFSGLRVFEVQLESEGSVAQIYQISWHYKSEKKDAFDPIYALLSCEAESNTISQEHQTLTDTVEFECAITSRNSIYTRVFKFSLKKSTQENVLPSLDSTQLAEFTNPISYLVSRIEKLKNYVLVAGRKNTAKILKETGILNQRISIQVFRYTGKDGLKELEAENYSLPQKQKINDQKFPWFVVDSNILSSSLGLEEVNPMLLKPDNLNVFEVPKAIKSQSRDPVVLMLTNIDTDTLEPDFSIKSSAFISNKVVFFYIRGKDFELGIRNYKSLNLGKNQDLIRLNTYDTGFNRLIEASSLLYSRLDPPKPSGSEVSSSSADKPTPPEPKSSESSASQLPLTTTEFVLWLTLIIMLSVLGVGFLILLWKVVKLKHEKNAASYKRQNYLSQLETDENTFAGADNSSELAPSSASNASLVL